MELWSSLSRELGDFLAVYGLTAIFAVMLLKNVGLPVPVPSDLILITGGVQAAEGSFSLIELFLALEVAVLVGGSAQFFIARGAGRPLVYRFGRYVGLSAARLEQAGAMLQRRGWLALVLGLNVPIARAAMIAASGLAGMSFRSFAPAMVAGSSVFYGWHVALGYAVGPSATTLLEQVKLPLGLVILGLALLGLIGWLGLQRRRRARVAPTSTVIDRLHSWTEAACPGCLAITALGRPEAADPLRDRGGHRWHK